MWLQFEPPPLNLLSVGTLWWQFLGVEQGKFCRHVTSTFRSQADDYDRHTPIWADFTLTGRSGTSTNHIQTTMITVMNNPTTHRLQSSTTTIGDRFQFQFSSLLFWPWAEYIPVAIHSDPALQFQAVGDIHFSNWPWRFSSALLRIHLLQFIKEGTDFEQS